MIYLQVEDVEQKFTELAALEGRKWIPDRPAVSKVKTTKVAKHAKKSPLAAKKVAVASNNLRQMLAEKRRAMMAAAVASKKEQENNSYENNKLPTTPKIVVQTPEEYTETVTFEGGFFNVTASPKVPSPKIKTPVKRYNFELKSNNHTYCFKKDLDFFFSADRVKHLDASLRKSLLTKRVSLSAGGYTMSKTPMAVINATNSIRRSMSRENSPVVNGQLDYDLDEEKENDDAGRDNQKYER